MFFLFDKFSEGGGEEEDKHTVFVRTSGSIKLSSIMSQSYLTINAETDLLWFRRYVFLELHIMCKLKLNILTSSSVTLLNS